jgi:hypothetical protein
VFVWLLREDHDGIMSPAWLEPKYGVIGRNDDIIDKMVERSAELAETLLTRGGK